MQVRNSFEALPWFAGPAEAGRYKALPGCRV